MLSSCLKIVFFVGHFPVAEALVGVGVELLDAGLGPLRQPLLEGANLQGEEDARGSRLGRQGFNQDEVLLLLLGPRRLHTDVPGGGQFEDANGKTAQ